MLDLHGISRAAFDLIVDAEVSGREAYDRQYIRPTKPGGASGVTVAIGYDCGYYTASEIRRDWNGRIPPAMVDALASCAGIKGDAAFAACTRVHGLVSVPWDAAIAVFAEVSIPKYLASTRKSLPNFDMLPPDCKGAELSLVYNRGASFTLAGDRYAEMREIRAAMAAQNFAAIPALFRRMKRLWTTKSVRGVALRREHEARLFEAGLASLHAGPVVEPPSAGHADEQLDPTAPFPAPDTPALAPDVPVPVIVAAGAQGDPELFSVQQRLKAMNFSPGIVSGVWGGMTAGAIASFINDRQSPITPPTSLETFGLVCAPLKAELARAEAEQWKRPVTEDRGRADPGTVATVAPEAAPVRRNFLTSIWTAIATFVAGLWQAFSDRLQHAWDFLTDHKDDIPTDPSTLSTLWSYVEKVPPWAWLLAIAGALFVIALDASTGLSKIREAVKTGARQ